MTSQAAMGAQIVAMSPMAGLVGSSAGGLAAGFVGGFIGSGGDLQSGLIGAAGGGLGGLASGLGALAGYKFGAGVGNAVRIGGRGLAGGTMTSLRGGSFGKGFGLAAGIESLSIAAVEMRKTMIRQSTGPNARGKSAGFMGDGFKLAGGRCRVVGNCADQKPSWLGGRQGGQGFLFGIPYSPGGFVDLFMETYAGPHDYLNSFFHYNAQGSAYNYSGFAYGFGEALSALNVGVATPFAAASGVPSYADSVLLSR